MSASELGNTKGQVTVFIILGILLALGAMFVFVARLQGSPQADVPRTATAVLDVVVVQDYVTTCLKQVSERGVRLVGMRGGFLNPLGDPLYGEEGDGLPSKTHYYFGNSVLPYLFFEKKARVRSLDVIAAKLQNYIVKDMQDCVNISLWEQQSYTVSKPVFEKVRAQVLFSEEGTNVVLTYPLVLERASERKDVSEFSVQLPLRFKLVHAIAERLLQEPLGEKYALSKNCRKFAAQDKLVNVYVRTNQYDYDYAVQVVDAKPTVSQKELPLKFQFATRNAKIEGECVG